jgi:hypothetical protein
MLHNYVGIADSATDAAAWLTRSTGDATLERDTSADGCCRCHCKEPFRVTATDGWHSG